MFREETLDQARVQVWIQVGAAVRNYKQTKVSIRRLEQRVRAPDYRLQASRSTAARQHRSTAAPQHRSTAAPQHRSTAAPQHRDEAYSLVLCPA
jgi:hypothetical protein